MNQNASAILTLCSHLCVGEGVVPLEPKEWSVLAQRLMVAKLQPADIFHLSRSELAEALALDSEAVDRVLRLIDRNASLSFELSNYANMGIEAVTRADGDYPARLKKILGNQCPPIFYCAGSRDLLEKTYVGYVGSRTVSQEDIDFTEATVGKTLEHGYGVVSGGAKGIDQVSEVAALRRGGAVVEYLSDSMMRKMRRSETLKALQEGRLLLLSAVKPDAGFHVGTAMMRNRYIYAQSSGTLVIRADYQKGGTWAGAVENLRNRWSKPLCWNHPDYKGNQALIGQGAIPVDEHWDGDVEKLTVPAVGRRMEQMNLFDL